MIEPTPKLHATELTIHGDGFVPLTPEGTLPHIEGPYHRESVRNGARAVIEMANMQHDAKFDKLTGIPNNEAFNIALAEAIEKAEKGEGPHPTILYMDLDNFKEANDTIGHEPVDEMLVHIANEWSTTLQTREVEHELVARKSGDEFLAMIYPSNTGNDRRDKNKSPKEIINGAINRFEKSLEVIAARYGVPNVGVSVGIATHKPGQSLEHLRQEGDMAMYKIKQEHKKEIPKVAIDATDQEAMRKIIGTTVVM